MTLKVIGTGFGRTGTESMRKALNMLGFGLCHHMLEVIDNEVQTRLWRELAAGGRPDWDELFAGFSSTVDWPSAFYWRELIAFYPEAKVLLTYRSAESWWTSFENTILPGLMRDKDPESLGIALVRNRVFNNHPEDKAQAIAAYEANVRDVKAMVPAERLLVHNLGDGWEPLCAFLGVPVPREPYPYGNTTADFRTRFAEDFELNKD